jgi:hypothetical protein
MSIWNLCTVCLLTARFSLTFVTTRQWSVPQSAHLNDRTSSTLECCLLSTKNIVNLTAFPSDVQESLRMLQCGNIVLWTLRFLELAKFTTLTPLSLLISCKVSFPIVGLKMSSLPTLAVKSPPNNIFICYLGNLSNSHSTSLQKLSFI